MKSICPLLTYMFKLKSWLGLSVRSWSVFPLPVPESRLRPLCSHSVHLICRSSSSLSTHSSPGHLLPHSSKSAPVLLQSVLVHVLVQYSPVSHLGYKRWPAQSPLFPQSTFSSPAVNSSLYDLCFLQKTFHLDSLVKLKNYVQAFCAFDSDSFFSWY